MKDCNPAHGDIIVPLLIQALMMQHANTMLALVDSVARKFVAMCRL